MLGYPLKDYAPSPRDDHQFISPLSLRWPDGTESSVFDRDIHGYHGELHAPAKLRGSGTPSIFSCRECGHDRFRVTVQFDYWEACDDLLVEEPERPVQDYFCGIIVSGTCANCRGVNRILGMDL